MAAPVVLVHGSGHGGWCWRDLVPRLEARGHRVVAPDLPGHGADPAPPAGVTAADCVAAVLAAAPPDAVLLGHSLGGMWITAAAEADPARFAALVYLCAWVPDDGQSARDIRRAARADALLAAMERSPDGRTTRFAGAALAELFYHDCPPETLDYARPRLCPEPVAPSNTPLRLTGRHLSVPRHYIRCLHDRVIPPEYQAAASRGWPVDRVHDLACGHSPFFSHPAELARLVSGIAA